MPPPRRIDAIYLRHRENLSRSRVLLRVCTNPEYAVEINSRNCPMISFSKLKTWSSFALVAAAVNTQAAPPPQRIDVRQFSKKVEDVVVPLPNEVFGALGKLGPVNWKEFVRTEKGANFTERPRIALLLGTVIADGFIAVQAEDAPAVNDIGQRVLGLAKGIGVGNSITPHAKAITEAADKRNWEGVRLELDRTQQRAAGNERRA